MVVPMIAAGELIGGLSFGGEQPQFPSEQMEIAAALAAQLAIAHARLFEWVRGQAAELEEKVRARRAELEAANRELES
jgi:GAF domain-containing protein